MPVYQFDAFELDLKTQRLTRDGSTVALKPKVFALLCHLVTNRERLLTRAELMDALWPNQDVADANLTQSIYELRKALGERRNKPRYIETVARLGFRFRGEVTEKKANTTAAGNASTGIASLTVLPFCSLPGADRYEALEYGISATLVTGLTRIPGLRIHQAPMLARFSEPGRDALAAGREAGSEAVLDGLLQCAGQRLRIVVRLIRVVDEVILWAEKFDQDLSDILAVEDDICRRLLQAIAPHAAASGAPLLTRHTRDPIAHELYLQCRYHWSKWNPQGWIRAIECGEKALEHDPGHAGAHTWIGAAYATLAIAGLQPPHESFGRCESYLRRALKLDENLGDAYECRGAVAHFYRWDWTAAERDLTRSFALAPSGGSGRGLYAILLVITGRPDEGLSQVKIARESEPLSPLVSTGVGEVYFYRRDLDAALDALGQTLELDPFYVNARLLLGQVHAARGNAAAALAAFETAVEHSGADRSRSGAIGYGLALNGDGRGARAIREQLIADAQHRYVDPYEIALISLGLREFDDTFEWLDAAYEQRSPQLVYLGVKGNFDPLHHDPRFGRLLRRIGLELQGTTDPARLLVGQD